MCPRRMLEETDRSDSYDSDCRRRAHRYHEGSSWPFRAEIPIHGKQRCEDGHDLRAVPEITLLGDSFAVQWILQPLSQLHRIRGTQAAFELLEPSCGVLDHAAQPYIPAVLCSTNLRS